MERAKSDNSGERVRSGNDKLRLKEEKGKQGEEVIKESDKKTETREPTQTVRGEAKAASEKLSVDSKATGITEFTSRIGKRGHWLC